MGQSDYKTAVFVDSHVDDYLWELSVLDMKGVRVMKIPEPNSRDYEWLKVVKVDLIIVEHLSLPCVVSSFFNLVRNPQSANADTPILCYTTSIEPGILGDLDRYNNVHFVHTSDREQKFGPTIDRLLGS